MTDDPERARQPDEVEFGELPELTRGLRAMGSGRKSGGFLQSQFFSPLLDARKRAAFAGDADAALRAFDPADLRRALDRAIDRIIQGWPDTRASARRAVRAELRERTADYQRALDALDERAADVIAARPEDQRELWRRWTRQLASTFDAADRAWLAMRSIVDALPPKP
ncbi:MAG TPA: hypothetical protein VJ867_10970 [Gemmatimonadaceae bacterium]|nr:hypothetical protein [Gemmatimonadaceae bacterium]